MNVIVGLEAWDYCVSTGENILGESMSEKEKIGYIIANDSDNVIYVSDPKTYEVIYLNKAIKATLGIEADDDRYRGQLCYELLQGMDAPCPFCTNSVLSKDRYHVWKHFNEKLGKYFSLKDKLIEVDGHSYRLEICMDITDSELRNQELALQLSIEETVVECVHALSEIQDMEESMNALLKIIGGFYQADRAYIFENDANKKALFNIYEWCKDGAAPHIEHLQNVPTDFISHWVKHFEEEGSFHFESVDGQDTEKSPDQEILEMQGIESLITAPIWEQDEKGVRRLAGFIGVDNPSRGMEHIKLLQSVAYFVHENFERNRMFTKLHEMSMTDELSGLGNRNAYMKQLEELEANPPQSLGVIFMDINGLKYANDHLGHAYGDDMIRSVAQGIHSFFSGCGFRIGGDEFVVLYAIGSKVEFEKRLDKMKEYAQDECICDFSMGVNFCEKGVIVDDLIARSDEMMYEEKQFYYGCAFNDKQAHMAESCPVHSRKYLKHGEKLYSQKK